MSNEGCFTFIIQQFVKITRKPTKFECADLRQDLRQDSNFTQNTANMGHNII